MLKTGFEVKYGYCVSSFLKGKFESEVKYTILKTILTNHNIDVLFGDDLDYFASLDSWISV